MDIPIPVVSETAIDNKDKDKDIQGSNQNRTKGSRKMKKKGTKESKGGKGAFMKDNDNLVEEASCCNKRTSEDYDANKDVEPKSAREDNRTRWASAILTNKTIRSISREFIQNKKVQPQQYTLVAYESHDAKNRYNDIKCIDATRVILKDRPSDDDYIHASWMTMPDGQKYICTQGPLGETLEDFWHMIYQEGCGAIVMLCNFIEGKHEKCRQYYPKKTSGVMTFGPYKVTIKEVCKDPFDTIKYQLLEVECSGATRVVHHFACPSWPDHTAPASPAPTIGMYKMVREKSSGSPIVVHCSAGIGRSATFIGIDYCSQKIRDNGDTNLVDMVKELRTMRFHSVQSPIQYIYLHMCLLELFIDDNVLSRKGKFAAFFDSYTTMLKKYNKKIAVQEARTDGKELAL